MTDPRVRNWNDDLIDHYRANGGHVTQGPFAGRQVLLLTTRGARSGQSRVNPLVFTRDGDRYIIVASKGGAPTNPDWYHNLLAHPHVTVEVRGEVFPAKATVITGPERDRLYAAHADLHPSFHDYVKRTDRIIPVIALDREPE
jgi:deazaflavin-dependent oxidoreductase (nitroreductase family)